MKNVWKLTGKHLSGSIFFNENAGWRPVLYEKETLAQMFSCEFLQSLKTNTSLTAETICTKVCACIFRNIRATGTQIMFVRISTDTISSLTMHFINQFSKQTRWLRWKNQMCIRGKNSIISIVPLFQIPLSWVW